MDACRVVLQVAPHFPAEEHGLLLQEKLPERDARRVGDPWGRKPVAQPALLLLAQELPPCLLLFVQRQHQGRVDVQHRHKGDRLRRHGGHSRQGVLLGKQHRFPGEGGA